MHGDQPAVPRHLHQEGFESAAPCQNRRRRRSITARAEQGESDQARGRQAAAHPGNLAAVAQAVAQNDCPRVQNQ